MAPAITRRDVCWTHEPALRHIPGAVAQTVNQAYYRSDDDESAFYVLALGRTATVGMQVLKESIPFSIDLLCLGQHEEDVAFWAFPSEEAASVAFGALESLGGSVFIVRYEHKPAYEDA